MSAWDADPAGPVRLTRLVRARVSIPIEQLGNNGYDGERVRDGIVVASQFAAIDSYRAATHNKGIMNGVDAVAIATGNDWRALEAGAHAYAARSGTYRPLATWRHGPDGALAGDFWSRDSYHTTWTASKDPEADLPDDFSLTRWTGSAAELDAPSDAREAEASEAARSAERS